MITYKIIGLNGFHKYHEFEEFTRQNHWDVIEIAKELASKKQWEWFKKHPTILSVSEFEEEENTVIVFRFLFGELNTRISNCGILESMVLRANSMLKLEGDAEYTSKNIIKLCATTNHFNLTIWWNLRQRSIRVTSKDNHHKDIAWLIAGSLFPLGNSNDYQNYKRTKTKNSITYQDVGWHYHPPVYKNRPCLVCEGE